MRQVLTVFRLLEVISNFEDEACRRFGCRFAGRVLQALLRHCAVETRVRLAVSFGEAPHGLPLLQAAPARRLMRKGWS